MAVNFILLFATSFLAGLSFFKIVRLDETKYKLLLAFSGSYLFAVTVVHLLPELYEQSEDVHFIGLFVLFGFFLQLMLEYFTTGVEHGHLHHHGGHHHHGSAGFFSLAMILSISFHALLEGMLLLHPSHAHAHGDTYSLLFGLILHKIPESLAFVFALGEYTFNKTQKILLLLAFSLASPLGMVVSNFVFDLQIFSSSVFLALFAIVAGNFLYISTTIFFENSPDHKIRLNRLAFSLLGALLAWLSDFLMF
ncbi:MAG TPA: ZIP family metal transporter [Cytophagaceae bacterium]|jgi:zinc and cadmium transporter|nr:ZIP family metal transporter [Cytophagaceae bacterium]